MSRSNPTLTNPAQHFFEWSGSKGMLTWYDKENKKQVQVRLPFEFLVLDELATITGYSKQLESGYWSNEVRSVAKDELFVRTKKGPFEAGLYANLAQTRAKGGKYAKSIYIAHKVNDEWIIGNIKAHGSALSAWIEFSKSHVTTVGKISMTKGTKQQAPTGEFYPPVFTWHHPDDDDSDDKANALDKELQIYLNQYLSRPKDDIDEEDVTIEDVNQPATLEQIADFEKRKSAAKELSDHATTRRVIQSEDDGDPGPSGIDEVFPVDENQDINLDDIPF